ncbi:putative transposase [Nitrosospira multiformis]|uniref:Putative transposase n=1 Tax=Nitrosospira multiformis TaxID=1231 RepID=A0A2T5I5Q9_9PROT|nr:putative transposase [Nitrosospira multiformis]
MRDYQSLRYTTWDCKYHVVFIPKRRKKAIFGTIRKHLGKVLHELAVLQKGCQIVEGYLRPDHVHMCISIPPKHSVSYVVGYIKGKSAISIARKFMGKAKNFTGENFWARGYFVSTWDWMKRWSESIFGIKRKRTNIMTSSSLACDAAFRQRRFFALLRG